MGYRLYRLWVESLAQRIARTDRPGPHETRPEADAILYRTEALAAAGSVLIAQPAKLSANSE